jgi:predicted DNA-binding protein with PD1-like motif
MKTKLLNDGQPRTWVLILEEDEDVVRELTGFAEAQDLAAAHFSAIGAFRSATIRYFDWETKEYQPIPVNEQVEVVSFSGNVSEKPDGGKKTHVHAVLAKRDGSAIGGDLGAGIVRPTLEVIVTEEPSYLRRRHDERTGLALISP